MDVPVGSDILIRVALHAQDSVLEIGSRAGFVLSTRGKSPADTLLVGFATEVFRVSSSPGIGILVNATDGTRLAESSEPLVLTAPPGGLLRAGTRTVRGEIILTTRGDTLLAVNELPLEEYLRGVVPREIGPRREEEHEAVAAQAVAARTYAVRKLGQYPLMPFDLFADVRDQVYGGVDAEDEVATAAIRETAGLVLCGPEGLLDAYYSSTCGGRRADIEAVWSWRESSAALRGGPDGAPGREWCRVSKYFEWTETWTGEQLSALVRHHLPDQRELPAGSVTGELTGLRVVRKGPSRRMASVEYRTADGVWEVPGDRNRWILRRPGGGILRSVLAELEVEKRDGRVEKVTARGRGNGHGVGLCQMGALGRARAGEGYVRILKAYFPGTRIRPILRSDLPEGRAAKPGGLETA
jgi:stage II sporulation protein D